MDRRAGVDYAASWTTEDTSGEKTVTEAEWLTCNDPQPMLVFLRGKASDRKLRLFEVASCRSIWHLLTDERSRRLVEVAEQYADGHPKPPGPLESLAMEAVSRFPTKSASFAAAKAAVMTIWEDYSPDFPNYRWNSSYPPMIRNALAVAGNTAEAVPSEPPVQAALLRDIFGLLPFRPIFLDPSWLTWHDGLLVSMAQKMYDSRDFRDMPVLADALEEAGCTNPDILEHCRGSETHVRGCWIVDLLLSKEGRL